MITVTEDQRTDAWHTARIGKLTGSRAADMLSMIKSGESAARRDLRLQLVCERLTGVSQEDTYVNAAMQRGIDKEADAFSEYEILSGHVAAPVGFLAHDTLMAGCSPDGQIGRFTGILELKCPKSATHLGYIRSQRVPASYLPQITHNLWITGAQWCDFLSFDDRFPPELRVFLARIQRADVDIAAYEQAALKFLSEVASELQDVQRLAGVAAAVAV